MTSRSAIFPRVVGLWRPRRVPPTPPRRTPPLPSRTPSSPPRMVSPVRLTHTLRLARHLVRAADDICGGKTFSVGGSGAGFGIPAGIRRRRGLVAGTLPRRARRGTRCEGGMGLTTTEGEEEERRLLTRGFVFDLGRGVCSEGEGAGGWTRCRRVVPDSRGRRPRSKGALRRRPRRRRVGRIAPPHAHAAGRRAGSAGARRGSARGVARTSPPKGDPRGGNPPASARALWGRARGGETRRVRRGRGWRSATTARNSRGVPLGEVAPATSASRADAHAEGAAIATRATASGARTTERDAFSNRRRDDARAPRRDADPLGSSRRASSQPCAERDDRAALMRPA